MSGKIFKCPVCKDQFTSRSSRGLRSHLSATSCGHILDERNAPVTGKRKKPQSATKQAEEHTTSPSLSIPEEPTFPPDPPSPASDFAPSEMASPSKRCRVTIEDVEDEGDTPPSSWSHDSLVFVDYPDAGAEIEGAGKGETTFERIKKEKQKQGEEMWAPFKSCEEWELARWLMMSGVSQADIDRFAKLGVIRDNVKPSFKDKRTFLTKIDELPSALGTEWKCEEFELVGNVLDKDGTPIVQTIELWKRDPLACIKELMQDP
ncbi:uncharacterized protein EV420DRAFT_1642987 [Desarmillaria tabescens]|uniref:Uncharacterized protein n=1 Tax=Armillaria tabescens TaxID=1929756 RepID=A0AA39N626_ARMTA|nr:uncharacterized protein EV420DRAFT_1642987 [Desarmillaria tabescens]KAK0458645.1 hypothetical protein EV420DRAFT_1642987 [Desarmillaria tabescens]